MFKRRFLLVVVPVILVLAGAAGVVLWFALPRKTAVAIEVAGTPGLTIHATCDEDGRSKDVTVDGSGTIALEGYRLMYSLVSTADAGQFRVKALIPGRTLGSAGSLDPPTNGVRGWVQSSWWGAEPANWIEVFNRDEQPRWLSPPPGSAASKTR